MFDFTKEVVINSKNFRVVEGATGPKIQVHGGGEYYGKYFVSQQVYKTEAREGKLAMLTIDAAKLVEMSAEGHISLNVELSLDKDARGDWSAAVYYFKNPMLVDLFVADWNADQDKKLAQALNKVLTDYKFVNVLTSEDTMLANELGVEAPAAGKVAIVGGDSNVCVRRVTVLDYVCSARCEGSSEEPVVLVSAVTNELKNGVEPFEYSANVVEFGTYNYLLHNLRLPTYENYRFTSQAAVEMPINGAKYVQYCFLYCVPRPGLGGLSVAGQFNHSTTTHVFFVKEDLAADFEAMFANVVPVVSTTKMDIEHPDNGPHVEPVLPDAGFGNVGGNSVTGGVTDGDGGETDFE